VLQPASAELAFTRLHRVETLPALASAPTYTATFERKWTVGSYTSLTRDVAGSPLAPAFTRQPADDERAIGAEPRGERALTDLPAPPEPPATRTELRPATPPLERGWHRFPGGTRGGDFVHKVLERLAAEQFELAGNPWLEQALRDRCQRSDFSEHADDLVEWMHALLTTELPSVHAPLSRLNFAISEMEFWMPVSSLQARTLDRLCCQRLLSGCERPALPERTLNGMLMGFADLVFEQGGRYWVLDYKTNRPRLAGSGRAGDQPIYDRASLESEMARHRYDVQAVVYLLALHRQLRARLGASYDPTRQLGGAIYWFIRGIDGPERGEYAIAADGDVLDLLDELDRVLGRVEEAQT
jgi:exodeoxyribonuclease V beta subunit